MRRERAISDLIASLPLDVVDRVHNRRQPARVRLDELELLPDGAQLAQEVIERGRSLRRHLGGGVLGGGRFGGRLLLGHGSLHVSGLVTGRRNAPRDLILTQLLGGGK